METFTKPRPTPVERRPTPADVFRATQRQKLEEQYRFNSEKMPALRDGPSPADITEPVFTHSVDLETRAVSLDGQSAAPLEAQALAEESNENKDVISDDTDVVAKTEAVPTMKRADFVKQQEDLFGANDEIKPEDVPQGELTYEQYLAQRPVAEEGDFYHHNNRVYSAVPTAPMKNKKAIYEAQYDTTDTSKHYDELLAETNRAGVIDDATKANEHFNAFDEAIKENGAKNESNDRIIRTNVEGEFLVAKDARLKGLLAVGEELLALHNSTLTGEAFEKKIRPALEAKQAIYDDLYELYENKGLDTRALWYIEDKTNARVDDPEFIPVEGSPYIDDEKVAVLDLVETTDGKKSYTIEKSDGSTGSVDSDEVTFKREFDKYEALEPELSRFERTKNWFGKERKKIQEFGGKAYMGGLWNKAGNWLTSYHINEETMTPAEIHSQKLVNRRNNMLGLAAVVVAGVIAQKLGVVDMVPDSFTAMMGDSIDTNGIDGMEIGSGNAPSVDIGHADGLTADYEIGHADGLTADGVSADSWPRLPDAAENADSVPMLPGLDASPDAAPQPEIGHADGGADFVSPTPDAPGAFEAINVNSPAYDIPYGGGGIQLFEGLGLSEADWNEHAQELANRFPDSFKFEGNDLRIRQSGLLPLDVRETIESFRNS